MRFALGLGAARRGVPCRAVSAELKVDAGVDVGLGISLSAFRFSLSPPPPSTDMEDVGFRFLSVSAGRRRPDEDLAKKMERGG